MASGRKNYFRHSFFARNDEFICELIEKFGLEGYYYYFALIEICGERSAENLQHEYKFHKRVLTHSLRLNTRKLNMFLTYLQDKSKISWTYIGNQYVVEFHNLAKYLGKYQTKYETNRPNKIKLNKIKVNKTKEVKKPTQKPLKVEDPETINLIDSWNDAKIITHKKTCKLISDVAKFRKRKSEYSADEIFQAIKNYKKILDDPEFNWSHKWDLKEFLQRENSEKFFGDNFDLGRFPKVYGYEKEETKEEAYKRLEAEQEKIEAEKLDYLKYTNG